LYGVAAIALSTSLCDRLVIVFIFCVYLLRDGSWWIILDEIYLRKVVGVFPDLWFSRDKSLVFFCILFILLLFFSTYHKC
jgi:hypothetical protein